MVADLFFRWRLKMRQFQMEHHPQTFLGVEPPTSPDNGWAMNKCHGQTGNQTWQLKIRDTCCFNRNIIYNLVMFNCYGWLPRGRLLCTHLSLLYIYRFTQGFRWFIHQCSINFQCIFHPFSIIIPGFRFWDDQITAISPRWVAVTRCFFGGPVVSEIHVIQCVFQMYGGDWNHGIFLVNLWLIMVK